jgi:membrane protease YdiL (CAAX protease family)
VLTGLGIVQRASRNLRQFLIAPTAPLPTYCIQAFLLAFVPSVVLVVVVRALLEYMGINLPAGSAPTRIITVSMVLGSIVFAPIFETFLLAAVVYVLTRFTAAPLVVALISAIIWGFLHGALAPTRFFGSVWAFFVLTCAYLAWRKRSFGRAFIASAVPHSLGNLAVLVLAWVSQE